MLRQSNRVLSHIWLGLWLVVHALSFSNSAQAQTIATPTPEQRAIWAEENKRWFNARREWNRNPKILEDFYKDYPTTLNGLKAKSMLADPAKWIQDEWSTAKFNWPGKRSSYVLEFARMYPLSTQIVEARALLTQGAQRAEAQYAVLVEPTPACLAQVQASFKQLNGERDKRNIFRSEAGEPIEVGDYSWAAERYTKSPTLLALPRDKTVEQTQIEERDYFDLRVLPNNPTQCFYTLRHVIGGGLPACTCKSTTNAKD